MAFKSSPVLLLAFWSRYLTKFLLLFEFYIGLIVTWLHCKMFGITERRVWQSVLGKHNIKRLMRVADSIIGLDSELMLTFLVYFGSLPMHCRPLFG